MSEWSDCGPPAKSDEPSQDDWRFAAVMAGLDSLALAIGPRCRAEMYRRMEEAFARPPRCDPTNGA